MEFISPSTTLEEQFMLDGLISGRERLGMDQLSWNSISRGFALAGIVAVQTVAQVGG